ncbi:MAG: DEAD/DEAH box helicase family protein [Ruminococcus flavefaciens]|nr:DEAD/DEAH box helicase family protein [Ruminococcus flavefaciens]
MGIAVSDWCDDAVMGYDTGNIKFMTYQKLAKKGSFYKLPENSIVVLDEIHYLLNDALFSYEPEIIKNIIRANKNRTKRVYISATIDEVLDEIIMLESKCDKPAPIDEIFINNDRYKINNTLID